MGGKGPQPGPEQPIIDDVGVESATATVTPGSAARSDVADDSAAGLANQPTQGPDQNKPDEADDKPEGFMERAMDAAENDQLPDNKWSRTLRAYEKEAKRLGLEGPITDGIKTIFALMAMYAHVGDLVPGSYVRRLDTDENLKNQKFSEEDSEKILAAEKPAELPVPSDAETLKQKGLAAASTIHACRTLWGINGIEDPDILSAKLRHAEKKVGDESVAYYRSATFDELTAQGMPYGTVLVFNPDISKADNIVAYATGKGTECQYFDAENGSVKIFNLATADGKADENSPISSFNLLTAFVPRFNSDPDWFKDNTDKLDARVNDTPNGQLAQAQETGSQAEKVLGDYYTLVAAATDLSGGADSYRRGVDDEVENLEQKVRPVLDRFKTTNVSLPILTALKDISVTYAKALGVAVQIQAKYYELAQKEVDAGKAGAQGVQKTEAEAKAAARMKPFEESKNRADAALAAANSLKDLYSQRLTEAPKAA